MTRYNHTRDDGPFDPCPECFRLMSRNDLFAYASSLRDDVEDLKAAAGESADAPHEYILALYDVKLVGSEAEILRYRRDVAKLTAEVDRLRQSLVAIGVAAADHETIRGMVAETLWGER